MESRSNDEGLVRTVAETETDVFKPRTAPSMRALRRCRAGLADSPAAALLFLIVLSVVGGVYSIGLGGPLLLDDIPNLSPLLEGRILESGAWRALLFTESGPLGRPVAMGSFLFNAVASGNDVAAWKWTNVMLHLLTGVLVFWLSAHLWCPRNRVPEARCWYAAFVLGAVWLLHPLHVSTVLYTVQRMTQLAALFVFSGLLAYVLARKEQLDNRSGYVFFAACFLVFLPLATLSKENGVLLAPLMLLTEACVFRLQGTVRARRTIVALFGVFLVVPALIACMLLLGKYHDIFVKGYSVRPFTFSERLLTELRVIFVYLQQLLVPIQQTMGFLHDDIVVSRGWLTPPTTLFSFLGLLCLLSVAWLMRRPAPLATLGILFYFAGHALESTIFPLEIAFEHRNYLPSYGVFLAVATVVARFAPRNLRAGACGLSIVVLTVLTVLRVQTWASEPTLLNYTYQTHPDSDRVNAVFAERLTAAGRHRQALALLEAREGPGAALQRLYVRCLMNGRLSEADVAGAGASFRPFVDHYMASGLMEVARLGITGACQLPHARYAGLLERAVNLPVIDPNTLQKLLVYRAHYLWYLGEPADALGALDRAHAANPGNVVPLLLATEYLLDLGRTEEARAKFERVSQTAEASEVPYTALVQQVRERLARCTHGDECPATNPDAVVLQPETDNVAD